MNEREREYIAMVGFVGRDIRPEWEIYKRFDHWFAWQTFSFQDPGYLRRKECRPPWALCLPISLIGLDGEQVQDLSL